MRALSFALVLSLITTSALAETIAPSEAKNHIGQNLTVEGVVSEVHRAASGKAIFLDIGGRYPNEQFTAVIFKGDFDKFPEMKSQEGRTIDVTGTITLYRGRPQIILNYPSQVKTK